MELTSRNRIKFNFLFLLVGLFLFFNLIPFVNSVPPVTTLNNQFQQGFTIVDDLLDYIQLNQNYTYNFFVFNISNGVNITNASTTCYFYLADNSGGVIYDTEAKYLPEGYWNVEIKGDNFSKLGNYIYGTRCYSQSANLGGVISGVLTVTEDGKKDILNRYDIVNLIFLCISVLFSILLSAYGLLKDERILIFASIFFLISGLLIPTFTFINNQNLLNALSIINYGLAFLCLAFGIYEWLPED